MKENYFRRSVPELVDMLARETEKLTHFMLDKNFSNEYEKVKDTIKDIQEAILVKKMDEGESPEGNNNRPFHPY